MERVVAIEEQVDHPDLERHRAIWNMMREQRVTSQNE
jgi:hypothetical protein